MNNSDSTKILDVDEGTWERLSARAKTQAVSMQDCGSGQGGGMTEGWTGGDTYSK